MSTIRVTSNIEDVIDSVDDVAEDLVHEIRKRVGRVMAMLKQRVVQYVREDSDYTGALAHSIHRDDDLGPPEMTFTVATNSDIAPYAAIIEYGSGANTENEWKHSQSAAPSTSTPPGYPYEAPDIDTPSEENKYKISGYPDYAGFIGHIEEWMKRKPVDAESGDIFTSAVAIAWEIANKGNLAHPFMRPAWFDKELQVRNAARNAVRNATR